MKPLLCIAFPNEIISILKLKYPKFYKKCLFKDRFERENNYALIILPVEQFIFLNKELTENTVIAFGDSNYLEEAFCLGAVDYLKNPWNIVELILRVEKVIKFESIQIGQNSIELQNSGISINGIVYKLSKREIKILSILFNNIDQIVSYKSIAQFINIQSEFYENSLYVSISKLKNKLHTFSPDIFPSLLKIENTSRSGYRLDSSCGKLVYKYE